MLDELLEERVVSSRGRHIARGIKRKMSNWPLRPRDSTALMRTKIQYFVNILK